jgi:hypothetical protein
MTPETHTTFHRGAGILAALMVLAICPGLPAQTRLSSGRRVVEVRDAKAFRTALAGAKPGTQILLSPGEYRGGFFARGLRGTPGQPVVIAARDPSRKPVLRGGGEGLKLESPAHLELRDLAIQGTEGTGLSIDDGGHYRTTPAHHVTIRGVEIDGVGENGLKMSGVDDFQILNLVVRRWTATGPSSKFAGSCAIDLIGCHVGSIRQATLVNGELKGGCEDILVSGSRFVHASPRAVQVGGSTPGAAAFRPSPRGFEARRVVLRGNVFVGGEAAVTFASAAETTVELNTFYRPKTWALRLLQEATGSGFVPAAGGAVIRGNIFAFRSDEMSDAVNVGRGTAPETLRFAHNWWYCLDRPGRSKPQLPSPETDGTYGVDPGFVAPEIGDLRLRGDSPARDRGAYQPSDDLKN